MVVEKTPNSMAACGVLGEYERDEHDDQNLAVRAVGRMVGSETKSRHWCC